MTTRPKKLAIAPAPAAAAAGADFASRMLAWYDRHRRALPWRALPGQAADPYAVWLSEIMLQQTTVQAAKPYFAKFLATWPAVTALARSPLDDVLRAWAGLGYYSRARNLHACAKVVAERHGGTFPSTEAELRALPGIGAYTAAAIAAIAFGRRATVVDGNVERVMTRLHAIDVPLPRARPLVYAETETVTPERRAGDFAQAMMDLGATICTPRNPACVICPVLDLCEAQREGQPTRYPARLPKPDHPIRHGTAYYIQNARGAVLVRTRPPRGLLGNMTELPGTPWLAAASTDPNHMPLPGDRLAGRVKHVFTHFTLMLDVVIRAAKHGQSNESGARWVDADRLQDEALPTLMRHAIATAQNLAKKDQSSASRGSPCVS